MHQSHIITGAQEFSSLWQEEMHFAYMIALGRSRLQRLEKLWLSLLRYRLLEETGAITAHPFWKGSQQVQPAVIAPENKLEEAVSSSCGNGEDVPFQRTIRICIAPGRELKTCYELVCAAGRHCAQQRHPRAVRSLQMGSDLLTLQPKQPEAQTFCLVLNSIPKIHSLTLPPSVLVPQAEVGMVVLSL